MEIITTYSVKIKHYNKIFKNTVVLYRQTVDFLINVCLEEWDSIQLIENIKFKKLYVEKLMVISILACTKVMFINQQVHIQQKSKYLFVILGIGYICHFVKVMWITFLTIVRIVRKNLLHYKSVVKNGI